MEFGTSAPRAAGVVLRRHWPLCLFTILLFGSLVSARYGNPAAGASAASRGLVPPSQYSSSMVSTPNPVDTTNNLVMTGNVAGGKAFRGNVPYGATTSFGGPLGTTSLDSFRRYAAVPPELSDSSPGYTPFYSSTGTVAKMPTGSTGVLAPGSPKVAVGTQAVGGDQPADVRPASEIPPLPAPVGRQVDELFGASFAPSPRAQTPAQSTASLSAATPEEMRRMIAGTPDGSPADQTRAVPSQPGLTSAEYRHDLDQLQRDFERVKTNASQFEQDLRADRHLVAGQSPDQKSPEPAPAPAPTETLRRMVPSQPPLPNQPPTMNPGPGLDPWADGAGTTTLSNRSPAGLEGAAARAPAQGQRAVGSADLALLSAQSPPPGARTPALTTFRPAPSLSADATPLANRIDALFGAPTPEVSSPKAMSTTGTLSAMQRVEETARAFDAPGKFLAHPWQTSTTSAASAPWGDEAGTPPAGQPPASRPDVPPTPKPATNPARSLESPAPERTALTPLPVDAAAQEKCERHLKSAQVQMRQGQYGRAAEFYTLAGLCNPRDARPPLGHSHALLAAGDYVNSAACLSKAIELDAPVALTKVDLIELLGGPDRCVQRINDLEQRAGRPDSPAVLQLLLAYIYRQMDQPNAARTALQAAKNGLPRSQAVDLFEAALYSPGK